MDRVTLQNYRCFREKQTARLAPLTFLVGENSTGKTSFLALLRALWEVAFQDRIPDFRQPPYDLGAFEDIVHHGGAKNGRPDSFEAGFEYVILSDSCDGLTYHVTFEDRGGYPFPSTRMLQHKKAWIEIRNDENRTALVHFGMGQNQYRHTYQDYPIIASNGTLFSIEGMLMDILYDTNQGVHRKSAGAEYTDQAETLDNLQDSLVDLSFVLEKRFAPFASAPVRARPKRTYDPSRPAQDPEGEYIPDYLANMSRNAPEQWERLKADLEDFGRDSGLFDEIAVLSFGKTAGPPFHVQIRKFGKRLKGPKRNLIDVGYGVS